MGDIVSPREFAALQERVDGLEGWQQAQNGTIYRVEAKVDKLILWIATTAVVQLGGVLIALLFWQLRGGK